MKKILLLIVLISAKSFAQVPAQALYDSYARIRASIKAGQFGALDAQTEEFARAYPNVSNYLNQTFDERGMLERIRSYVSGNVNPQEQLDDVIFNIGMIGLAGPQSGYFFQEANITTARTKNFINFLAYSIKVGKIADKTVGQEELDAYYKRSIAQVIQAAASSHWQGNHVDSYNYDAPQTLIPVYSLMTEEFGSRYANSYLSTETLAQLQLRRIGPAEYWQEPLDIIAEVVRRSTQLQNGLYNGIDSRDYFFFIQNHFARIFGAPDVEDKVELTVGQVNNQKNVLLVCNTSSANLDSGPRLAPAAPLLLTAIISPVDNFLRVQTYTCGQKVYEVDANDVRFRAVAPLPKIARIDDSNRAGFNALLSYIYFQDMPQTVVNNLITAMSQNRGWTYLGETPIENSRTSLTTEMRRTDKFYRVGHVSGESLNLSFTQGRELKFTKMHEGTPVNFTAQVPGVRVTGTDMVSRQELAEALWDRSVSGRHQSLNAMGIACHSASYINTWMDAYFEAVMGHPAVIGPEGNIQNFDPPFVVGATNTFNSSAHRESMEGLTNFLDIILIDLEHSIDSNPAYNTPDQSFLRTHLFQALAANRQPYIASSNHDQAHTREMSSRLNIRLTHGTEVIDRVYSDQDLQEGAVLSRNANFLNH